MTPDDIDQDKLAAEWAAALDDQDDSPASQTDIDALVVRFSKNWKLARIAKVELTILRLAVHEILSRPDIPLRVSLNEAIELSKRYGDENSRNFINGILDALAKAVDSGEFEIQKDL